MNALEASLFAGLVAIGATLAIERWGGVVGGFVATLPSTILPATWGLWSSVGPSGYRDAMAAVPFGMLVNAMFLHLWRVVPRNLPPRVHARLAWTLALALTGWLVLALLLAPPPLARPVGGAPGTPPVRALDRGGCLGSSESSPASTACPRPAERARSVPR